MHWGKRAQAAMKAKGLILADIAAELDVSIPAVSHWFANKRKPKVEQIIKIARMLDMSVSELVGEDAYFLIKDDERALIDLFRALDTHDRDMVIKMMNSIKPEPKS